MTPVVGLIVNPIAGMGGRVGLKGSDGDALRCAVELGARPEALDRARRLVSAMVPSAKGVRFLTCSTAMGADAFEGRQLVVSTIVDCPPAGTSRVDTMRAATALAGYGVDLLLFVGGDGTARDVCEAVGESVISLGVPAGVKMHSAVFATTPQTAAELAGRYLGGRSPRTREGEVMDIDEDDYRAGRLSARLFGYLRVPSDERLVQGAKACSALAEAVAATDIAEAVVGQMERGAAYILGPGTTTRAIAERLGVAKTLIGVDVVQDGKVLAQDVGERELLDLAGEIPTWIVVTVVGGQGYLFGRGNQQISPRVIRLVGRDRILVVATEAKLAALRGRPLLVDTGDEQTDVMLAGYLAVSTGRGRSTPYRVEA
jgi:predicted polyphosphate/ATP-dependent NAD kinase